MNKESVDKENQETAEKEWQKWKKQHTFDPQNCSVRPLSFSLSGDFTEDEENMWKAGFMQGANYAFSCNTKRYEDGEPVFNPIA